MTEKALISGYTWRSLEMQREAFMDMPTFIAPDDLPVLLRKSQRKDRLFINTMSLAVVADSEKAFEAFWKSLPKNCSIRITETGAVIQSCLPFNDAKKMWQESRKFGAAKIGGRISAEKKEAEYRKATDAISDRWPKPTTDWPTSVLLAEAGKIVGRKNISYNTAIKYLGKRPIAQYNYQAALKRKERRNARAN